MGTGEFNAEGNPQRTSIPSRGSRDNPSHATESEIISGLKSHLVRMQTFYHVHGDWRADNYESLTLHQ